MATAVWILLALSVGVCMGFILCSVMTVSSEEQRRAERLGISRGGSPLGLDTQH